MQRYEADDFVFATGSWTAAMDLLPGPKIPVQAGKGYSFAVRPAVMPKHAVLLTDVHVGCTPFDGFLRIGGTMEFSGVNREIDNRRVQTIVTGARECFQPFADNEITQVWTGPRPITPDGLPVLGRAPGTAECLPRQRSRDAGGIPVARLRAGAGAADPHRRGRAGAGRLQPGPIRGIPAAPVRMSQLPAGRVVVLDDDPTGTQGVAGLPVVLNPGADTLRRTTQQWSGPLWVLTNTRAMPAAAAVGLVRQIAADVRAVAGPGTQLVLRGDSTLRGHVLAEIDALSPAGSVALFVPAFLDQGRVTVAGVHYVTVGGRRVPVAQTEYARDPEFGYRTSDLVEWVGEQEPGRPAAGMPLDVLRAGGPAALADLLVAAPDRCVVVPDAETTGDLEIIAAAWAQAQSRGRPVVLRCAATMASVVTRRPAAPAHARTGRRTSTGRVRVVHVWRDGSARRPGRARQRRLARAGPGARAARRVRAGPVSRGADRRPRRVPAGDAGVRPVDAAPAAARAPQPRHR